MASMSLPRGALCGRLASHFAVAAAAAVGVASHDADAQIVHWSNANIPVPSTSTGVYINVETRATGNSYLVPGWDLNPYGSTSLTWYLESTGMMRFPGVTTGAAGSLAVNTVVGPSGSFDTFGSEDVVVGSAPGNWRLNDSNYFGFRFEADDGSTKYGWGRFVVGSSIAAAGRMIAEIAYESSGASIAVGATGSTPGDSDSDGVPDASDNCPNVANANQADSDADGVGNVCDNCPSVANADQANFDSDSFGDACDSDSCPDNPYAVAPISWYRDADSDLFGSSIDIIISCSQPAGYIPKINTDCNDSNAAINPAAQEVCDSGNVDEDCDGLADNADPSALASGKSSFFVDADNDNFGTGSAVQFCDEPALHATVAGDCNDANPAVNPSATEVCDLIDNNCNSQVNEGLVFTLWYADGDSDGYGSGDGYSWCSAPAGYPRSVGGDCNDANPAVNPSATEVCDLIDNNCNGQVNEGLAYTLWYADGDSDGYGSGDGYSWCSAPAGYPRSVSGDCNDANSAIKPGAIETCDGVDNNCVGGIDEGFPNFDSDGFADCVDPDIDNDGSLNAADCNDFAADVYPGAPELCANINVDNDCDGNSAEAEDGHQYFRDGDGDGFGAGTEFQMGCTAPAGWGLGNQDCNDANAAVNPAASDTIGNGIDDNCDGYELCWLDADSDGFLPNSPVSTIQSADLDCFDAYERGTSMPQGDCGPTNSAVYPGAPENCANLGTDNDCDGYNDAAEASDSQTYFADGDNDGYGTGASFQACGDTNTRASVAGDCNDANGAINPGAAETCDGIDNNCAAGIDEGFPNFDGDSYADCVDADTDNDGSLNANDCNDFAADIYPDAPELCSNIGIDNDCDGNDNDASDFVALWIDADGDGYGELGSTSTKGCPVAGRSTNSLDCNDANPAIRPGAAEVCDGIDNDCDSLTDDYDSGVTGRPTWYRDQDSDGYGDPAQTLQRCVQPASYVGNSDDGCPDVTSLQAPRTWYRDQDSDGYGDPLQTQSACTVPSGYVGNSGDGCPDVTSLQAPRIWYRDQDIDGQGDPANTAIGCTAPSGYVGNDTDLCPQTQGVFAPLTFYRDQDGDGFGDPAQTASACSAPTGFVGNSGDGCPDVYALQAPRLWYRDQDGDGAGDAAQTQSACTVPSGFVGNSTDGCPDVYALQAPVSYYIDGDRDGYGGSATASLCATSAPDGYSSVTGDCNDAIGSLVNPIRYYLDGDGDGAGTPATYVDLCQKAPPPSYVTNSNDQCDGDAYKTEPGVCGCGVSDADSDGDGVSDCIDTTPALRLVPRGSGQFYGAPIVIDVTVSGQVEASVGAQLALNFDTSKLAFVSIVPGGGPVFNREIVEIVDSGVGTILYAVGESVAGGGSTASATVATITFSLAAGVDEVCNAQNLVAFGSVAGSSSRLASATGGVIMPTPINLGAISASATAVGLNGVPAPWTRPADAGVAGSVFAQPAVTANVPCGTDPTVTLSVTYPAGHTPASGSTWPSGGVFPVGTTTVTWTAPATGGGSAFSATREFTVLNHALMNLTVSLPGVMQSAHERTVQFKIGSGPWTGSLITIVPQGSGTSSQGRGTVSVQVPVTTTAADCLLVRDAVHTVADLGSLVASGTTWMVAVTLVQGDSNADNRVDILDYAYFLLDQVGTPVSRDARSNFNGDTFVNNDDFSFLSSGFFAIGDACSQGGVASDDPVDRISVAELRKRGEGDLAIADLNRDGWVDLDDMSLWLQGVRPEQDAGSADQSGPAAE